MNNETVMKMISAWRARHYQSIHNIAARGTVTEQAQRFAGYHIRSNCSKYDTNERFLQFRLFLLFSL